MNSKRCLVFAAHGDDETNGVGGTILKLRDSGWSVFIVYATLPTDPSLNHRRKMPVFPSEKQPAHVWMYGVCQTPVLRSLK